VGAKYSARVRQPVRRRGATRRRSPAPERVHRGAGIGTALLGDLLAEAAAAGRSVTIHVERFNPAPRLYQRLGFRQIADRGVYLFLGWSPSPDQAKTAS
jgi:predicted N-acetyltransferase YhbS